MSKKLICLIIFVLVFSLVNTASADYVSWAGSDIRPSEDCTDFKECINWGGALYGCPSDPYPAIDDSVDLNGSFFGNTQECMPVLYPGETAQIGDLDVGCTGSSVDSILYIQGLLDIIGNTVKLGAATDTDIPYIGTIEVNGIGGGPNDGVLRFDVDPLQVDPQAWPWAGNEMILGYKGTGYLILSNGAYVEVNHNLKIGDKGTAQGFASCGELILDGGSTCRVRGLSMQVSEGSTGVIDFKDFDSRLIIDGNDEERSPEIVDGNWVAVMEEYNSDGLILGEGQQANNIKIEYDDVNDQTLVYHIDDPNMACCPDPDVGEVVPWTVAGPTLTWGAGFDAQSHKVNFGKTNPPPYVALRALGSESYSHGQLDAGQKYYWSIDEFRTPEPDKVGSIWSFTMSTAVVVDNMEDYNDPCDNFIASTWVDSGTTGSAVALVEAPVHGGSQAMEYSYDNNSTPYYSERVADINDLICGPDWTEQVQMGIDIKVLDLWFYGDPCNVDNVEQLYVLLEDGDTNESNVIEYDTPNDITTTGWQVWQIELTDFTGADMDNIDKIYIGFGDRTTPAQGGEGKVLFDDIELHPSRCTNPSDIDISADFNEDCEVDIADFAQMAGEWLNSGMWP